MGSWCCNKDGYWPVQFPSTHPTTVSASTWKSPAGSSSGQWCLYYFLFSLNCHPILNYILFSQQHHLSTPLLLYFFWSILAIPDHLLTLDLPRSATLPFFFSAVFFHLRMFCHSISTLTVREAMIMLRSKCTFTTKSFLIPTVRIKICPLCGPSK